MERIDVDKMVWKLACAAEHDGVTEYVVEHPGAAQVRDWIRLFGTESDGILKRLIAGIQSAGNRAGMHNEATAKIIRAPRVRRTSDGNIRTSTVRITIDSSGGWYSARSYRMVAIVDVTQELFSDIQRYRVRSGAAVVGDADATPYLRTYFGGKTVGEWIAGVYFGRLMGRAEMQWLAAPEWHANARAELAATLQRLTSGQDLVDGLVALCGATHDEVTGLCYKLRKSCPALVPAMDEFPDYWEVTATHELRNVLSPGAAFALMLSDG